MANARFDIGPASAFESRDGGLTKGGLIRNGFVEKEASGEAWSWQRPALATGTAAPCTGAGLGMLVAGDILYGLFNCGTAGTSTSARITIVTSVGTSTAFTLTAAAIDTEVWGYNFVGANTFGGLSPSTWKGAPILALQADQGTAVGGKSTTLVAQGTISKNAITSFKLNGFTYRTNISTYSVAGGNTTWKWPGPAIAGVGLYGGTFT